MGAGFWIGSGLARENKSARFCLNERQAAEKSTKLLGLANEGFIKSKAALADAEGKISQFSLQMEEKDTEIRIGKTSAEHLDRDIQLANGTSAELRADLTKATQNAKQCESKVSELNADIENFSRELQNYKRTCDLDRPANCQTVQTELEKCNRDVREAKVTIEQKGLQLANAVRTATATATETKTLTDARDALIGENKQLNGKILELNTRVLGLEATCRVASGASALTPYCRCAASAKNRSVNEATSCFRALADSGHAGAARQIAACRHSGLCLPRDQSESVQWDIRACESGEGGSCYRLARISLAESRASKAGPDRGRKERQAAEYLLKAFSYGNAEAHSDYQAQSEGYWSDICTELKEGLRGQNVFSGDVRNGDCRRTGVYSSITRIFGSRRVADEVCP